MLTRDELLHIARRYDTVMSHAMLQALGFKQSLRRKPRHKRTHDTQERRRYRGMRWCFRNYGSPMDWH